MVENRHNRTKSGVYEIPFTKEDRTAHFHVGMTNKTLKTRIKEYIGNIKYNNKTTALARLYNKEPLQINLKNNRIIYPSRFYLPSIIGESIEIFLRHYNICNDSASMELPKIWKEMLRRIMKQ